MQPLTSPLTVYLLVKSKYKLPAIKDQDQDNPSVSIVYYVKGLAQAALPTFVTFNNMTMDLNIAPTELEEVGTHNFQIILEDDHKYPLRR